MSVAVARQRENRWPWFVLLMVLALCVPLLAAAAWQFQRDSYGLDVAGPMLDFRWQAVDGQWYSVTEGEYQATYLFLGYLACSDVCPVRLGQAVALDQSLGGDPSDMPAVRFLFVTLNPEHDTAELRAQMIDRQSQRIFSGEVAPEDLSVLQTQLRENIQSTEKGEVTGHAGNLYLLDASAQVRRVYPNLNLSNELMMQDLEQLIASQ